VRFFLNMRRGLSRAVFAGFALFVGALSVDSLAVAVTVGQAFPAVAAKGLKVEDRVGLTTPGKVTIVNFWATWCEACKIELAEFETKFKPLVANSDFQVTLVSLDKDPAKAKDWFKSNIRDQAMFERTSLVDPEFQIADQLAVDAFPMTFVVGRDGKVAHIQRGYKPELKQTEELVKIATGLLGAGSAAPATAAASGKATPAPPIAGE